MKDKKQNEIVVLLRFAGKYKVLTFLGMFLSAVAMIMGMAPYVCIWLAARDINAISFIPTKYPPPWIHRTAGTFLTFSFGETIRSGTRPAFAFLTAMLLSGNNLIFI